MPEDVQEIGREGAATLKRWLEATTYMEMPYNAYQNPIDCRVETLNPEISKSLDLVGRLLVDTQPPIYIEAKRYSKQKSQYPEFQKFQAIAYSNTALEMKKNNGHSRKALFLWVTYHPFNLDNWSELQTYHHMVKSLKAHPTYLNGEEIDTTLAQEVADRVSVLVFNDRQEAWTLTREELAKLRTVVTRKVKDLD